MIDKVLSLILDELNLFLTARFAGSELRAVLSDLVQQDGTPPPQIENKLVLSLVNIERETGLNLNLYLRVAANFASADYIESLQFLSAALEFFQDRPVFTAPGMERLNVQMLNLTIQDLHSLWSISGSKYLPSAFYKLRMATTQQS
jgi:hypothetical protein